MTPVFSGEIVRAMIVSAVGCSLIPLVFLGYYRAKTGVKLASFFIGMGIYFVFSFFGGSILNMLFLSIFTCAFVPVRTMLFRFYIRHPRLLSGNVDLSD